MVNELDDGTHDMDFLKSSGIPQFEPMPMSTTYNYITLNEVIS